MTPGHRKSMWRETRPKKIANGFFALQILLFREENSRQSRSLHSHSSFLRRSFFAVRAGRADSESGYSECGPQKVRSGFSVTLANEADRFEYSGSWLAVRVFFRTHLFPAFTAVRNTGILPVRQADIMSTFLLQRSWNSAARTDYNSVFHSQTIGLWEIVSSYSSATAPASHRISRAAPLFQTRKELSEQ